MVEVSFKELMKHAEKNNYAVGYFESWNLESVLALNDAAERLKSPIIIGFGGLFLTNEKKSVEDPLNLYAKIAKELCSSISVPACTLFNESLDYKATLDSIDYGYNMVMYIDANLQFSELVKKISEIVEKAHKKSVAVEAELEHLPGLESITEVSKKSKLTDPETAKEFVSLTGIDALSINIGQSHGSGGKTRLDLNRLKRIKKVIEIPLVLHGATNLSKSEIRNSIDLGVHKFNMGGILKKAYLDSLIHEINNIGENYNLYEVIGSGFKNDILIKARLEVQKVIEKYMKIYRSAGKA